MGVEEKAEGKGQSSLCSQVQGNGYSQFLLPQYFRNSLKTHEVGLREEAKKGTICVRTSIFIREQEHEELRQHRTSPGEPTLMDPG